MPEAESPSARTADSFDNTCNRLEKTHATQSEETNASVKAETPDPEFVFKCRQ